eukprot:Phypoly_transcript_01118.p1 GENE.Phypoly_transcript_01118~~Phypoly_transcript_01118.p1  ORF type:complete len:1198 (+),score=147.66 Phypoly_transcript_01118:30-3623(+)
MYEVRKSEPEDVIKLQELFSASNQVVDQDTQGFDVSIYIERDILALTVISSLSSGEGQESVVAFASFVDAAPIPNVLSSEWELWFSENFSYPGINVENTLWLNHLLLSKSSGGKSDTILEQIFEYCFSSLPNIDNILLCAPPNSGFNSSWFTKLSASKKQNVDIFLCGRTKIVPPLLVRLARVEDHDDLVPIFNKKSELNPELHNQYFLASLMSQQTPNTSVLVAEVNKRAVGIMSLTTAIEVHQLRQAFSLEPFNFLKSSENLVTDANSTPHEHSAICITLFCLDERYTSRSVDFIKPVFQQFPTKEYLLMTQPHKATHTPLHNYFTFVPQKNMAATFQHVLYLLHRHSLDTVEVKQLHEATDAMGVRPLVANLGKYGEDIMNLIHASAPAPPPPPTETPEAEEKDGETRDEKIEGGAENKQSNEPEEKGEVESTWEPQTKPTTTTTTKQSTHEHLPNIKPYILLCDLQIVGVAILDTHISPDWFFQNYNVEAYINTSAHHSSEHAHLRYFIIHPIFEYKRSHFLQELMRKNNKTTLYYKAIPTDVEGPVAQVFRAIEQGSIFSSMYPVEPRRQIQYPSPRKPHNPLLPPIPLCNTPLPLHKAFELLLISKKLLFESKVTINTRIVVVGASITGLSFIDTLLKTAYLNLRNIILVNPGGMPDPMSLFEPISGDALPHFFPFTHEYSVKEFVQCGLPSRITIVDGKMVLIDRERKLIALQNSNTILNYDYLVLTTGLQENVMLQTPVEYISSHSSNADKQIHKENGIYNMPVKLTREMATGFFSLGTRLEVPQLLEKLARRNQQDPVLVYGTCLEVYCAVQGLLSTGVEGTAITVITLPESHSFHPPDKPPFNFHNSVVENKISEAIKSLGVTEEFGMVISRLLLDNNNNLSGIVFTEIDSGKEVTLDCKLMLSCGPKDVDTDTFYSINDACLIYDGRLVIDDRYQTNDKAIYATGSVTKFSRRFRTTQSLLDYSSREIGQKLAQVFLDDLLNSSFSSDGRQGLLSKSPLQLTFATPIVKGAILPGGVYYLHIRNPQAGSSTNNNKSGSNLTTDTGEAYLNIHLDDYGLVESITYLGQEYVEVGNFVFLIDLSHFYLYHIVDNVFEKIDQKSSQKANLISFLREDFILALYHDHFTSLRQHLEVVIASYIPKEKVALDFEKLHNLVEGDIKKNIQKKIISYLAEHQQQLHMYYIPNM